MPTFPAPLTLAQVNDLLQQMTITALGLPENSYASVRIGWQTEGQPFEDITADVVYLFAVEEDDDYNRLRDNLVFSNDNNSVIVAESYTRVWRFSWTFYGPNSFDRARRLRSALFNTASHDAMAAYQLYLITDPAAPVRVPEVFQKRWWERVDFSARFNELVVETDTTGFIKSAEIIVEDATGVVADVTVAP